MTGASSWRNHLSLIVGVSLPVLLVLLFWLAMAVPRLTVEDPRFDLVLSSLYNQDGPRIGGNLDFQVNNGELVARFTRNPYSPPENQSAFSIPAPRLYYFSTAQGSLRELDYELPDNLEDGALVPLRVLDGRRLIDASVAPDGYRFDNSYRGSRGFLFFFDGYRYNARIEKDGRAIRIPSIDPDTYVGNYDFVAWVGRDGA